jgi:hypothetical protein
MKNILDKIYNFYAEDIESDSVQLTKKNKEKLLKKLDSENKESLEKLIDAYDELLEDVRRESFRQGFCANTKLIFEMFACKYSN